MVGIILFLTGYIIRVISIRTLKNKLSWRIFTPSNLVMKGIYKYIRHPMYLGGLIMGLGIFLFFTNWRISICLSYLQFMYYMDRIDREEQLLINAFGPVAWDYISRTKRFVPYLF